MTSISVYYGLFSPLEFTEIIASLEGKAP